MVDSQNGITRIVPNWSMAYLINWKKSRSAKWQNGFADASGATMWEKYENLKFEKIKPGKD